MLRRGLIGGASVALLARAALAQVGPAGGQVGMQFPRSGPGGVGGPGPGRGPAVINVIRNSTMVGAVAGTPGTNPTNWSVTAGGSGMTTDIVGTGSESGLNYIDLRVHGTATATAGLRFTFDTSTALAAAVGQQWVHTVYQRFISISGTAPSTVQVEIREFASGVAGTTTASTSVIPTTAALNTQRVNVPKTLGDAGTTTIQPTFRIGLVNLTVYDFVLRLGAPQLERGLVGHTWVPTP